jgi:hypothetical protein
MGERERGTRTRDLRRDRRAFTGKTTRPKGWDDGGEVQPVLQGGCPSDSVLQAFCEHRTSAAMSPYSASTQRPRSKLARSLDFGGIRRNASTQSRRLITRGRRFRSSRGPLVAHVPEDCFPGYFTVPAARWGERA